MPLIRVGGWRPDPVDARDKPFALVRPALLAVSAEDEHIIPSSVPIMQQGGLQSCVANGTCDAFELLGAPQLSRLFVYWNARRANGDEGSDVGTYVRSAFESLRTLGACLEDLHPYDESRVNERPSLFAYEAAYDHRISAYYRIDSFGPARADDVETAIRANHPVVFGTLVGQSFVDYAGQDVVWHPATNPIGGHALCIDGVRRVNGARHFRLRNSWGADWGMGGCAWAAEDWITDVTSQDFWVATAKE